MTTTPSLESIPVAVESVRVLSGGRGLMVYVQPAGIDQSCYGANESARITIDGLEAPTDHVAFLVARAYSPRATVVVDRQRFAAVVAVDFTG